MWFADGQMSLKVRQGPLEGRQFNNLLDFLDAQAEHELACPHTETRPAEVVSGMATSQPHHTTAIVCRCCRKVLRSNRQPVNHKEGRRLQKELSK